MHRDARQRGCVQLWLQQSQLCEIETETALLLALPTHFVKRASEKCLTYGVYGKGYLRYLST